MEAVQETLAIQYLQELELKYGNEITELKNQLASHQNCDYWKSENGRIGQQLISIVDEYYEDGKDAEVIVRELCEIIDYQPTFTVEFTATVTFNGRIEVPADEKEDFDLTDALGDVYVDINNGNVVIDSYDLENVEEC